jgi:hypothetical protein
MKKEMIYEKKKEYVRKVIMVNVMRRDENVKSFGMNKEN